MANTTKTIKTSNNATATTNNVNNKGVTNMANTTTTNNTTATNNNATAKQPKVNTLNICATTLNSIKDITFTHNTRNITISNSATGKKCFEIWRRQNAIRLYIPNYLLSVAKGVKNSGIYNIATGFNGYPQGTYSIYIPTASIPQVLNALVTASLNAPQPQKASKPKTTTTKTTATTTK